MFRRFVKLSSVRHSNARLIIVRRLERTSTIHPDDSADRTRNAKLTKHRFDELSEFSYDEMVEKLSASARVQPAREQSPEPARERSSESARLSEFASSASHSTSSRPARYARESSPQTSSRSISNQELGEHLDRVLQDNNSKASLNRFLASIKPALYQLKPHQLAIVFRRLNELILILNRRKIMTVYSAGQSLHYSPDFAALLNRTNSMIQDMTTDDLTIVFNMLRKTLQDPETPIVQNAIQQITQRLNRMSLEQLSNFLMFANLYLRKLPASGHLIRCRAYLLESCHRRILNNELKPENFSQLNRLLDCFFESCKSDEELEVVERLAQMILTDCELDFTKSVSLLDNILSASLKIRDKHIPCPTSLGQLIERCNSIVIETLESNPRSTANYYQYLDWVYLRKNEPPEFRFPEFFDPKLLDLAGSFLAREYEVKGRLKIDPIPILRMCFYHSNLKIFNQKLIELACRLITSGVCPTDGLSDSYYLMLTEYRWPFVDQQRLLQVFKTSDLFLQRLKYHNQDQRLLCNLILNEVNDRAMLNYLNQSLSNNSFSTDRGNAKSRFILYERITLTSVVFSMFNRLADRDLEMRIQRTLDQHFRQARLNRPGISMHYINIDNRLQHNGFLTNGLRVWSFAIYDKSIGDLIPLDQFKDKFDKINTIPLSDTQEL